MPRTLTRSLIVLSFSLVSSAAFAHDIWINKGSFKNPAGEWCCGAEDCGVVSPNAVHASAAGYSLRGAVTYGVGVTGNAADGPTHQEPVNETRALQPVAAFARRRLLALQTAGWNAALLLRAAAREVDCVPSVLLAHSGQARQRVARHAASSRRRRVADRPSG